MRKVLSAMSVIVLGIITGCMVQPGQPNAELRTRSFNMECNSWGGVHRKCPASGIIEKVDIVAKHSESPCDYGSSWGWNDNEIWVDKGCRATFSVTAKQSDTESKTRSFDMECNSWEGVHRKCPTGGIIEKVDIVAKHSESPCDYGSSWGWNDNEIWVDKGCRATFSVTVKK